MYSTQLCSFLLIVITGTVFPGHILGVISVTEKSFEQAVLPPFVDGLNFLASVAENLLTSSDLPQVIQNVRQLLESSHQSLSKAEQSSLAQVKSLSANVEERLVEINRLNDEQKVLQDKQQGGHQDQESLAKQLQAAQKDLKNAFDAIDKATKAWYAAAEERKKGIGMIFLPVFGSIIGGVILGEAVQSLKKATNDLKKARLMRTMHKKAVEKYALQIQTSEVTIRSTEQTIAANTEKIKVLQQDLNSESALHQNLNKFLISLRKCTSLLSTVGKTSAANMYVELSGVLDGLLGVLDEIIVTLRPFVESSKEHSLLISARLPTIIQKLQEANLKLKKAAAS
ncbi:uncharacterized protein LOC144819253 [Lissotriton helveticus]